MAACRNVCTWTNEVERSERWVVVVVVRLATSPPAPQCGPPRMAPGGTFV